jgi:hypothetical protein
MDDVTTGIEVDRSNQTATFKFTCDGNYFTYESKIGMGEEAVPQLTSWTPGPW